MPFRVNDKPLAAPPVGLTQDAGEVPLLRTHAFMDIAEMQFLLVEGGNEDSPPLGGTHTAHGRRCMEVYRHPLAVCCATNSETGDVRM